MRERKALIVLNDIQLSFGQQKIFDGISCNINKNVRMGLVGRNGSGKSTLLKVIAGLQGLDEGVVAIEKNAKIGYMPQEVVLVSDKTIYEETLSSFTSLYDFYLESRILEKKLDDSSYVDRYAQVQQKLLELNFASVQTETKKMLSGLGFHGRFDELVSTLSVGWRMRIVLAKLLLQQADFYLFDEPTNHLDIVTKDWFLDFLQNASFGFMLVCHDRYFLDHACEKILELENGHGILYHGNYMAYEGQKELRQRELELAAERQQKEIASKMRTVARFRASATKAKMAQSMLKKIEKIERIELHSPVKTIAFSFPPVERSGKVVLKIENVAHAFGEKEVFINVSGEVERNERVAIVAPNGVGKTTLFNLITGKIPLQKGHIAYGYHVEAALFEQDQEKVLSKEATVLREVENACKSSETRALVRKFLGSFLFSGDEVEKKIGVLSGGEKNRVAMVKVLLQQANLLLLDEPTNHLDIYAKEVLLKSLQQYEGTIVFVSHDRDFLDKLATRVFELSHNGIVSYSGNYESYLYQKNLYGKTDKVIDEKQLSAKESSSIAKTISNKELYESRKVIAKLESKIDRLEKKSKELNTLLETGEYGTEIFTKTYVQLIATQTELENVMKMWEELQIVDE